MELPTVEEYFSIVDGNYPVKYVIDGDTIVISTDDGDKKVRLIGVDTPEIESIYRSRECFGEEASNFLKEKLNNQVVYIEFDKTQGDLDKYGRLLRYIWLQGELINKEINLAGYGEEYTYRVPYKYQKDFLEAEEKASEAKIGLWNHSVCAE